MLGKDKSKMKKEKGEKRRESNKQQIWAEKTCKGKVTGGGRDQRKRGQESVNLLITWLSPFL